MAHQHDHDPPTTTFASFNLQSSLGFASTVRATSSSWTPLTERPAPEANSWTTAQAYGYGTLAIAIISLLGLVGALLVPIIRKKAYAYAMLFFVAMAVGTLTSDALLHLIPMALKIHNHDEPEAKHAAGHQDHHDEHDHGNSTHSHAEDSHQHGNDEHHDHEHDEAAAQEALWKCCAVLAAIYVLYLFEWFTHSAGALLKSLIPCLRDVQMPGHSHGGGGGDNHKTNRRHSSFMEPIKNGHSHSAPHSDQNGNIAEHQIYSQHNGTIVPADPAANGTVVSAWNAKDDAATVDPSAAKHSHNHSDKASCLTCGLNPLALMITIGDAVHNFADGMAIGAAFAGGATTGLSTTIAVFCHEVPHELGDFAVLLNAGVSLRKAIFLNLFSSITAFAGLYVGLAIAGDQHVRYWVFAAVAGVFLYIGLVDMMPELKHFEEVPPLASFVLQNLGLGIGFAIMLLIALFEDKIKV